MKLSRRDLRTILYDFNCMSNRLLQANYEDYNGVLAKFIRFLKNSEIIYDYIVDCGECDQDIEQEFKKVWMQSNVFFLGDTDEEEVRNIFEILNYIVEKNLDVIYTVGRSYSNSSHFQDILNDFNERVTSILIMHIENYLTKVGIKMGIDDSIIYNISLRDGQINIANDNASIEASNVANSVDAEEIFKLINAVKDAAPSCKLSDEDKEALENSLEVIDQETKANKPRKPFLKTAVSAIKAIKGTTEFTAAVTSLIQFIQPFL